MPPFKQNVGRLLNVDRESQQELGKILRRESSHCLTGTTKSANTKRGPHCHNALASNQIPDTTPDDGSEQNKNERKAWFKGQKNRKFGSHYTL